MDLYDLESDIKMDWYPKEKLNYVKRKLKGDNPGYITRYVNLSELICDQASTQTNNNQKCNPYQTVNRDQPDPEGAV